MAANGKDGQELLIVYYWVLRIQGLPYLTLTPHYLFSCFHFLNVYIALFVKGYRNVFEIYIE